MRIRIRMRMMISKYVLLADPWGDDPIWLIFFRWVVSTSNLVFTGEFQQFKFLWVYLNPFWHQKAARKHDTQTPTLPPEDCGSHDDPGLRSYFLQSSLQHEDLVRQPKDVIALDNTPLRIQVCPKKGITRYILILRKGLEPSILLREGSGFLRLCISTHHVIPFDKCIIC